MGLYYPNGENKGADQLRSYREAGLRLLFCIYKLLVFSCGGSIYKITFDCMVEYLGNYKQNFRIEV